MEVQAQVMDQFNDSRMGDTVEVLCDGWDGQSMSYVGRSYAESPGIDGSIYFTSDSPVEAGDLSVCASPAPWTVSLPVNERRNEPCL